MAGIISIVSMAIGQLEFSSGFIFFRTIRILPSAS